MTGDAGTTVHAEDLYPGMHVAPPWPCDAWTGPARLTSVMLAGDQVDLIGQYADGSRFRFAAPCWLPVTILEPDQPASSSGPPRSTTPAGR